MVLARSKQILDEPDDRALLNCLTLSFSNIMIAFLLFYAFCGCPGQIGPSLLQDDRPGTGVEPLEENMKWSDIVFSWFKGSSVDEVNNENTIIEDVGVEEKDEKSNSIRELLQETCPGPGRREDHTECRSWPGEIVQLGNRFVFYR